MIHKILVWLFRLSGWKVNGIKPNLKKYVIIVAPHTSNWDFFVGWAAGTSIRIFPNLLAKKELFKIPFVGWFLSSMGGVEVDRKKNTQLVQEVLNLYKERDEFIMVITPEGTRSYVPKWKTGFYRIAVGADIPILKVGLDYKTKTVFFDKFFYPSGDMEKDMEEIKDYFKKFKGKNPENGVK